MKRSLKNLFIAVMLIGGSLTGFSASARQPENINDAIISRLKSDTLPETGKAVVYVSFYVDKNGDVKVLEMNGSDQRYLEYVKSNLLEMNFSEFVTEKGKTHNYRISFSKS